MFITLGGVPHDRMVDSSLTRQYTINEAYHADFHANIFEHGLLYGVASLGILDCFALAN